MSRRTTTLFYFNIRLLVVECTDNRSKQKIKEQENGYDNPRMEVNLAFSRDLGVDRELPDSAGVSLTIEPSLPP